MISGPSWIINIWINIFSFNHKVFNYASDKYNGGAENCTGQKCNDCRLCYKFDTENIDLKMFLDVENGSIAVSQAKCITHHINIALSAKNKRFTKTFLDAVLSLQLAADVLNNMFSYMLYE